MAIHNHLIRAYHGANMYWAAPQRAAQWRIPSIFVPAQVHSFLDADDLIEQLSTRIDRAKGVLEENRTGLDQPCTRIINHLNGRTGKSRPYSKLHAGIRVTENGRPVHPIAWKYDFNAYEVGSSMLGQFRMFVEVTATRRYTDFGKLSRIHQRAEQYRNSAALVAEQVQEGHFIP